MSRYLRRLVDLLPATNPVFNLIASAKANGVSNADIERIIKGASTDSYGRYVDPVTGEVTTPDYGLDDEDDGYGE